MRILAAIVAVPVLCSSAGAVERPSLEARLQPIASAVAGRQRRRRLPELLGRARSTCSGAKARCGSTRPACPRRSCSSPAGAASGSVTFARSTEHRELDCLAGRIDWRSPTRSRSARRATHERRRHDLRHPHPRARELPHGRASRTRRRRTASRSRRWPGRRRSSARLPPRRSSSPARWRRSSPAGAAYATTDCHAGRRLDLHPETPDFPTELPARSRGLASGAVTRARVRWRHDPRQRRHPHPRPLVADGRRARDHRAARRRRRRHARMGVPHPRAGRPRGPLRDARVHGLPRALPDLGARPSRRPPRGSRLGGVRAHARRRAPPERRTGSAARAGATPPGRTAHGRGARHGDG